MINRNLKPSFSNLTLKIVIAIPIYNEKKNILELIKVLRDFSNRHGWHIDIVIVDDNSPDGSGDEIKNNYSSSDGVHLICRSKKMGLGSAYINAFNWILNNLKVDVVIQMDADFSHPPDLIPEMLDQITSGADVVIASRYTKNGGVENWSISRKILSIGANLLFKLFIGTNIKDVTGGYRAFRFEIIRKLMKQDLSSKGYEFQIETIYHLSQMTKKVIEIPFVFKKRTAGKSKLSLLEVIQFALKIVSLRNSTVQYSPPTIHKIKEKIL